MQQLLRGGHVSRNGVGVGIDPSCMTTVARIARKGAGADCALLQPVNVRTSFVRKLIGSEPGANSHSVIGRFASRNRATIVFVAGWRRASLLPGEIPLLARAVRMMWETAHALASPCRNADVRIWLEELAFPAVIVDEDLHIHELNGGGRTLLTKGELLKPDGTRLAASSSDVTEGLREAVRETLVPRAGQRPPNTTVPLSTERQQFAFAKIGAVPALSEGGKVLISCRSSMKCREHTVLQPRSV
jgi:hypothetical protein